MQGNRIIDLAHPLPADLIWTRQSLKMPEIFNHIFSLNIRFFEPKKVYKPKRMFLDLK